MKDNRCPFCGRELKAGEACYHDELPAKILVHNFSRRPFLYVKGKMYPLDIEIMNFDLSKYDKGEAFDNLWCWYNKKLTVGQLA